MRLLPFDRSAKKDCKSVWEAQESTRAQQSANLGAVAVAHEIKDGLHAKQNSHAYEVVPTKSMATIYEGIGCSC